ncbi:hypothetical protein WY02_06815 [Pseudonocardia sp. AL041005-10]|nr:hypothetical protein WY02_06815 [Pseudonocardia sp. AL041005-10]ALE83102.1 hypothetical protein XF36_07985 [Pseudonocardia sp. HH130629-09]
MAPRTSRPGCPAGTPSSPATGWPGSCRSPRRCRAVAARCASSASTSVRASPTARSPAPCR